MLTDEQKRERAKVIANAVIGMNQAEVSRIFVAITQMLSQKQSKVTIDCSEESKVFDSIMLEL